MKVVILCFFAFLAVSVLASEASMKDAFLHFQKKYNKVYSSQEEFKSRFEIFKQNMRDAAVLQRKNPKAKFGVTKFSDLSKEEFAKFYLMPNFKAPATMPPKKTHFAMNKAGVTPDPTNFDWATTQYVTPVRNQGQCGSCWAFSAVETVSSYFALDTNQAAQLLSVEQVVDCDTAGQDQGCNGGFPTGAYSYIQSAGGLESESAYPYTAEGGQSGTCNFNQQSVVATVTGSSQGTSINGETGIYQQLSTAGPVSVCVDASSWSSYQGGVLTSCTNNVDHCVQATGYANYNSQNAYWIVRNSWGTDWGESGFIWIQIGQDLCSIGDYATIVSAGPAN